MKTFKFLSKVLVVMLFLAMFLPLQGLNTAYAQTPNPCSVFQVYDSSPIQKRLEELCKERINLVDAKVDNIDEQSKNAAILSMIDRQMDAAESYLDLEQRVNQLNVKDDRKKVARDELAKAKTAIGEFVALMVSKSPDLLDDDPFRPSAEFNTEDKKAKESLSQVNRALISPIRPGVNKTQDGQEVGGVPEGDLLDDFIPGIIRLLFRFTSLVIFISFLVSGVMYITAFGNEDNLNKARRILYYSLIGFAVVTLAFAIVQAITDIDFFGFI